MQESPGFEAAVSVYRTCCRKLVEGKDTLFQTLLGVSVPGIVPGGGFGVSVFCFFSFLVYERKGDTGKGTLFCVDVAGLLSGFGFDFIPPVDLAVCIVLCFSVCWTCQRFD